MEKTNVDWIFSFNIKIKYYAKAFGTSDVQILHVIVYRRSLTRDIQPESYTIFNYKNKDSCNRSVVADVRQLES